MILNGVELDLFPLIFDKSRFNYMNFWAKVLVVENDEIDSRLIEPSLKIEEFNIRLKRKHFRKKIIASINFKITENIKASVRLYSSFRKLKKPSAITLANDSDQKLIRLTKYYCKDTGESLKNEQIGRHFILKDEKIEFDTKEINSIKGFLIQEFCLVGFKPKESLKIYHNISSSVLITPDDENITNSTKIIDAMVRELINKNKIAIAKIKIKENARMRFCALIPQIEEVKEYGNIIPTGFNMVLLPFGDEIKNLESMAPSKIDIPTIDELLVTENLINQMTVEDFDPRSFENPEIQRFYSVIQSLALDEPIQQEFNDFLMPDLNLILDKINVFNQFNELFFKDELKNELELEILNDKNTIKNKKDNIKQISQINEISLIENNIKNKNYKSLKIQDLISYALLKKIDLNPKLKKNDIIEILSKFI